MPGRGDRAPRLQFFSNAGRRIPTSGDASKASRGAFGAPVVEMMRDAAAQEHRGHSVAGVPIVALATIRESRIG